MKKFFALVLTACMLLTSAAMGEATVSPAVLQDELPPAVVTTENADGETIVAKIFDAQGSEVAQAKDDGSVVLTDVNGRTETENSEVAQRLGNSYNGVMEDVSYSDVASLQLETPVKVDINAVIESLGLDSYDLVMYELFDVMLSEDIVAQLTEGSYLELTLQLIEEQNLPLVVIFSADGVEWEVIDFSAKENNSFSVDLMKSGTIALLADGTESMNIGKDVEKEVVVIPGNDRVEADRVFSNFTPSVSGKEAPGLIIVIDKDGTEYAAYIRSVDGEVEIAVPNKNYIVVTSVAERDYVMDIQTHEHLEWSYAAIQAAENVGALVSDNETGTIAVDVDAALEAMNAGLTHEQLVVKDLFEVSAYGDYVDYLYNDDYYLDIVFDANLNPEKPLVVIYSADSVHWNVHPAEFVTVHEDGSVTVRMNDLGSVAFLVEEEVSVDAQTAVQSPN